MLYFNVETTQIQLVFKIDLKVHDILMFSLNLGPLIRLVLVITDSFLLAFFLYFSVKELYIIVHVLVPNT